MTITDTTQFIAADAGVAVCTAGGTLVTGAQISTYILAQVTPLIPVVPTYVATTWNPTITSAATTPTFTTKTGTYTQIGRMAFFEAYFNNTVGGTPGSGANQITLNFPVSTSVDQQTGVIPVGTYFNNTNRNLLLLTIGPSASSGLLWQYSAGVVAALTNADLNNVTRQIVLNARILV